MRRVGEIMTNMIDVNSLWNCETCYHHKNGKCDTWCESSESYRPAYSKLKVVKAVEVVHGEWVDDTGQLDSVKQYKCSNCGKKPIVNMNWVTILSNYCPNCGAKMNGKKVE